MRTDPLEEWRRLTDHYRTLTDGELEELGRTFADLTGTAQQILRDEMRSRGLRDPLAPPQVSVPVDRTAPQRSFVSSDPKSDPPLEYTWKTLLRECTTRQEAWQISEALRRAGIESWVDGPGMDSPHADLDVTNPRVLVAADELDRALMVASQPIPQDIIDESRETVPEFQVPHCPACGAADPLLEDVNPLNAWRCEACGRQWTD